MAKLMARRRGPATGDLWEAEDGPRGGDKLASPITDADCDGRLRVGRRGVKVGNACADVRCTGGFGENAHWRLVERGMAAAEIQTG